MPKKGTLELMAATPAPPPERAIALIPPPADEFLPPGLAAYVRQLASAQPVAALHQGPGRVEGPGGPEDDIIDAELSDGEYTLPAEVVDEAGDGDNDAGADLLDDTVEEITGFKPVGSPRDKETV